MLATFTVNSLSDVFNQSDGQTTLREALFVANVIPGEDTINFDPALLSGGAATITLIGGELTISDSLILNGLGSDLLTINANGDSRVFNIDDSQSLISRSVTIQGLTIAGGNVAGNGGGIRNRESLLILASVISGNVTRGSDDPSDGNGGGIYHNGLSLSVVNSTISDNGSADLLSGGGIFALGNTTIEQSSISQNGAGFGGGIYHHGGELTITSSTIFSNGGYYIGGGILHSGVSLTITDSNITENAGGPENYDFLGGGGIVSYDGTLTIIESTISGNVSSADGGGVLIGSNTTSATILSSTISGNTAGDSIYEDGLGGGIANFSANLSITNSTISDNVASEGAGLYNIGTASIGECTIFNNQAVLLNSWGGGIFNNNSISITDSVIAENQAGYGGGLYNFGTAEVSRSTFDDNHALSGGGILNGDQCTLYLWDSTIANNVAVYGGGLYNVYHADIRNSTFSANIATDGAGGGIYSEGGTLFVFQSTITNNTSLSGYGGGVCAIGDNHVGTPPMFAIGGSIIAGNTGNDVDVAVIGGSSLSSGYNIFGVGSAIFNSLGDLAGVLDPLLGPLADNGGPTFTHALLAGSPAINAGDLAFAAPPDYDQRGEDFDRVAGGRIDIGAFEVQATAEPSADFDNDGDVDGRDFLAWQRGFGTTNATLADGDADGDEDVDGDDLDTWHDQYGEPLFVAFYTLIVDEPPAATISSDVSSESAVPAWIDIQEADWDFADTDDPSTFAEVSVEEVDRAFDSIASTSRFGVRGSDVGSGGDFVSRRGIAKRTPAEKLAFDNGV